MAVSYVWPAGLPQNVRKDYSESIGTLILRTQTDAGPAKMRKRGKRPDTLSVGFYMSSAQVDTLRTFVDSTIKGTARFGFPHPRTGVQVEARIIPQDNGQLFTLAYSSPGQWTVDMMLEILP